MFNNNPTREDINAFILKLSDRELNIFLDIIGPVAAEEIKNNENSPKELHKYIVTFQTELMVEAEDKVEAAILAAERYDYGRVVSVEVLCRCKSRFC